MNRQIALLFTLASALVWGDSGKTCPDGHNLINGECRACSDGQHTPNYEYTCCLITQVHKDKRTCVDLPEHGFVLGKGEFCSKADTQKQKDTAAGLVNYCALKQPYSDLGCEKNMAEKKIIYVQRDKRTICEASDLTMEVAIKQLHTYLANTTTNADDNVAKLTKIIEIFKKQGWWFNGQASYYIAKARGQLVEAVNELQGALRDEIAEEKILAYNYLNDNDAADNLWTIVNHLHKIGYYKQKEIIGFMAFYDDQLSKIRGARKKYFGKRVRQQFDNQVWPMDVAIEKVQEYIDYFQKNPDDGYDTPTTGARELLTYFQQKRVLNAAEVNKYKAKLKVPKDGNRVFQILKTDLTEVRKNDEDAIQEIHELQKNSVNLASKKETLKGLLDGFQTKGVLSAADVASYKTRIADATSLDDILLDICGKIWDLR